MKHLLANVSKQHTVRQNEFQLKRPVQCYDWILYYKI